MKQPRLAVRLVALAISSAALGVPLSAASHSLEDVEQQQLKQEPYVEIVNAPAPSFELQESSGRTVSLEDFRGKVIVLYFIYATCPDVCPLNTQKVVEVQEHVNRTPMLEHVQFVAITTDPASDTAEVLERYMADHRVDRRNFVFLTSGAERPTETRELAELYRLAFTPTDDGYQVHGAVTNVIDREGNLGARYHGLDFNAVNVVLFANALVNDLDAHPMSASSARVPVTVASNEGGRRPRGGSTQSLPGIAAALATMGLAVVAGLALWRWHVHRKGRSRSRFP